MKFLTFTAQLILPTVALISGHLISLGNAGIPWLSDKTTASEQRGGGEAGGIVGTMAKVCLLFDLNGR